MENHNLALLLLIILLSFTCNSGSNSYCESNDLIFEWEKEIFNRTFPTHTLFVSDSDLNYPIEIKCDDGRVIRYYKIKGELYYVNTNLQSFDENEELKYIAFPIRL